VNNFSFYFELSFLIGSPHVHKFLNVKVDDHTPCLYSVQNRNGEQIICDKVLKLQFLHKLNCNSKTYLMPFVISFYIYKQFKYMAH